MLPGPPERAASVTAIRTPITKRITRMPSVIGATARLCDLRRQFAYDRLLARVFSREPEAWVLKGATALLARLEGSARHTLDIDLYRLGARLDEAEVALRAAASARPR